MRRRRSILSRTASPTRINVTPMIDVVMVLIVFFLIVGKLATDRRQAVRLPESASGETRGEAPAIELAAELDPESNAVQLRLGEAPVSLAELPARLGEVASARAPLRLRGDRRLDFDQLRPVLEAAREAGVGRVQLATERAP